MKPLVTRFLTGKSDFTQRKTLVQEVFAESGLVVANWAELNTKERGAEDIQGIGRKISATGDMIKAPFTSYCVDVIPFPPFLLKWKAML